uniref:PDZ and LIM domain protein 2 n=1 Tax=Chelonoidis abingdonii TaxID=106734 RepID=A0A8C0IYW6_CHEAB
MSVTVNLTGPAPWGFRITGGRDFRKPIIVSKVTEHGKAAAGDLRPGDIIVSINGDNTADMLNVEAQNKIKQSSGRLQLQVDRESDGEPGHSDSCVGWLHLHPACLADSIFPQDVVRTRDDSQGSVRSSYSSPVSLSPRPGSPFSSSSPGYRPGSPYSPQRPSLPSEGRVETVVSSRSLDSELTMRRLEEDSEVYKMMQENREIRAAPRQSNTFRLLQVALETDGGGEQRLEGTGAESKLSPSTHKPVTSSVAGVQKLHTCEKCGTGITTQAVRIQESRYRHPSCYICADCGLNLKMRGHFWVGEELYCEKHARQRYQSPREGAIAATAISSKS